ncbi:MAG: hypothetical protein KGN00_01560 [Chloroflexota bacterium]|nr:hypothetical protein [Chloroflexota bacterium]MDE3192350.1 hypothetical protein [Chloroflexota bacterium]
MSRAELVAALDEAAARASRGDGDAAAAAPLLLRVLTAAAATSEVTDALADVSASRALLRVTDADAAIELQAGNGRLHAEPADVKGKGPKIDAASSTWLGLLGGTLRPWLAFTRGLVVCRAGLDELRWIQSVAERLQRGYENARAAETER